MPEGYCSTQGNNANYEWIDLVRLGSIDNATGNDGGYADYTSMSTDLSASTQYTIYVSAGFSSSSYTEFWHIWIDYNRNGFVPSWGVALQNSSCEELKVS